MGGAHPEQANTATRGVSGPSLGGNGAFAVPQQGMASNSPVTPVSALATGLFVPTSNSNVAQTGAASAGLPDLSVGGNPQAASTARHGEQFAGDASFGAGDGALPRPPAVRMSANFTVSGRSTCRLTITGAFRVVCKNRCHGSPVTPVSVFATGLLAPISGSDAEQNHSALLRGGILPRPNQVVAGSSGQIIPREEMRVSSTDWGLSPDRTRERCE